jgi:hypothetical protein
MRTYRTGLGVLDAVVAGGLRPGVLAMWGMPDSGVSTLGRAILKTARPEPTGLVATTIPDPRWLRQLRVDPIIAVPGTGELGFETAYHMLKEGVRVVLIDHLPGLVTSATSNTALWAHVPYAERRLIDQGLSMLRSTAKAVGALVVVANQMRWSMEHGIHPYLHDTVSCHMDHAIEMQKGSFRTIYGQLAEQRARVRLLIANGRTRKDAETKVSIWPRRGIDETYELLMYLQHTGLFLRVGAWWKDPVTNTNFGPGYRAARNQLARKRAHYIKALDEWKSKSS